MDMIIRGGQNIYPRETVAAVIRVGDAGQLPTATQLHEHLRPRPAPHQTPKQWFATDQFPADAMGTSQKFRVKDAIMAGELTPLQP